MNIKMTWLHTKQLLKNVMKEKDISVKCRKVSNDGKVSGALTSWEKSNAWPGGEKWSKNMTRFRDSASGETQIMTKDKEIRTAF